MSCELSGNEIINSILTFLNQGGQSYPANYTLKRAGYDVEIWEDLERLGTDMMRLNLRAYNYRYSERKTLKWTGYEFNFVRRTNEVQAYKYLVYWMYQCTEGTCHKTKLFKLMRDVCFGIAHSIIEELPEYKAEKWGV